MVRAIKILVLLIIFSTTLLHAVILTAQQGRITINSPKDNEAVSVRALVEGQVSDIHEKEKIYVLVHPLETSLWWVQPLPSPPNQDIPAGIRLMDARPLGPR